MSFANITRRQWLAGLASLPFAQAALAEDIIVKPLPKRVTQSATSKLAMQGKLSTQTEILTGRDESPMISFGAIQAMDDAIALYEEVAAAGGWQILPPADFLTKKTADRYLRLRQRLVRENYLDFEALNTENPEKLDDDLLTALKTFQIHHGIAPSGKLNERTLAELNVTADVRLSTLRLNQPRIHEYLIGLGTRSILVNIPSIQLETVENSRVHSRHNIVVGKLDRPTPALKSMVTDVTFNPYWNVPASIVERDIVPKYLADPSYLDQMHIRVFDGIGGPEIDPSTIDWEITAPDRYHFQQLPGEHNALASVKVNFKNEFMVYMHDTPHRELFATNARYDSSGCVRVDQVRDFVTWILNGQDGFDAGQFEMITASQETVVTKIETPTDVRFMYLTAWATEDGRIHFRPDIYDLDDKDFILGQPEPLTIAQTL